MSNAEVDQQVRDALAKAKAVRAAKQRRYRRGAEFWMGDSSSGRSSGSSVDDDDDDGASRAPVVNLFDDNVEEASRRAKELVCDMCHADLRQRVFYQCLDCTSLLSRHCAQCEDLQELQAQSGFPTKHDKDHIFAKVRPGQVPPELPSGDEERK